MNTNNYILSDSPTKTAKANKFERPEQRKGNQNYLFDFALLNKTVSNSEYLKDIKHQVMDYMNSIAFHFVPVFKNSNVCTDYDTYYGNLYFKPYPVYSDSKNKQLYIIFQLIKIEHLAFQQRNSVYDEYTTVQEINEQIADNDMIEEINIA
jgi:hypothetical protein